MAFDLRSCHSSFLIYHFDEDKVEIEVTVVFHSKTKQTGREGLSAAGYVLCIKFCF